MLRYLENTVNIFCNWSGIWAVMAVLFGLMPAWGARKCTQSKHMMASPGKPNVNKSKQFSLPFGAYNAGIESLHKTFVE